MTQNNVSPSEPINQRRLKEITNLPSYVIRHLKKTRQLEFQRVGTEDIFDETSVNRFMESFRIEDYLTIGECREVLEKRMYYSFRPDWRNTYIHILGFYITVIQLIRGGYGIPDEYRLTTKKFGKTVYVSKESFKRTLEWLDGIHRKRFPITTDSNVVYQTKPKKSKKLGLGRLKKINITRQQTPHPMVIPFMECPFTPLTH